MQQKRLFAILLALIMPIFGIMCSRSEFTPVLPAQQQTHIKINSGKDHKPIHNIWGFYEVVYNSATNQAQVNALRQAANHFNIINFLEQNPCTDCFTINSISPVPEFGALDFEIALKHPYDDKFYTGFDVRGIVIFNGSRVYPGMGLRGSDHRLGDSELINADGFTTLYNPDTSGHGMEGYIPGELASGGLTTSVLNGYKRYSTNSSLNTRNAFFTYSTINAIYRIKTSTGPLKFGYAVDASRVPPTIDPVFDPMTDFPIEANCPESWQIIVNEVPIGDGLNPNGGSTKVIIDCYDWQGSDNLYEPLLECPDLFDGTVTAAWVGDFDGYTRYEAIVENQNLATSGRYHLLVRKEASENDPVNKPWLDLSAYQIISLYVKPILDPGDVTPDTLKLNLDFAEWIQVDSNYVWIIGGELHEAQAFDISDPYNPVWVASYELHHVGVHSGLNQSTIFNNGYAFVPNGPGFWVFDIDPPEETHEVTYMHGEYGVDSLAIDGDYLYGLDKDKGLQIFNISDLESIYVENSVAIPKDTREIVLSDGYAYLYNHHNLYIIDIATPALASIVKHIELPGDYPNRLTVTDGFLYYSDSDNFRIFDVDPPEDAYEVHVGEKHGRMASQNGYLYILEDESFKIYNLADPSSPALIKSIPSIFNTYINQRPDVHLENGNAYIACGRYGLAIVDISPPALGHIISRMPCLGRIDSIAAGGGYCNISSNEYEYIMKIDVDPPEYAHVTDVVYEGIAHDLYIDNGLLYVGESGLTVFKNADSDLFDLVGYGEPPHSISKLIVRNGLATTISNYTESWVNYCVLDLLNVSSVTSPVLLKTVDLGNYSPSAMAVTGDYICVSDFHQPYSGSYIYDFRVIDASVPDEAFVCGVIEDLAHGIEMAASGNFVYCSTSDGGVYIFDISQPDQPLLVNTIEFEHPNAVDIQDNLLYITTKNAGLQIYDISEPASPVWVGSFEDTPDLDKLDVDGQYAYTSDGDTGRFIIIKLW